MGNMSLCSKVFIIAILLCTSSYFSRDRISISINAETFDQLGGGGSRSRGEFHFGKDAELFFASIDLKWLWNDKIKALARRETWMNLFDRIANSLHRLEGSFDTLYTYREKAMDILLAIRNFNATCTLRVFQNSLKSAAVLSMQSERFVLFYIEEEHKHIVQSVETFAYRKALAEESISKIINDKFIFLAGITDHPYSRGVIKLLELNRLSSDGKSLSNLDPDQDQELEFPILVVMSPLPLPRNKGFGFFGLGRIFGNRKQSGVKEWKDNELSLEILATLQMGCGLNAVNTDRIAKFLRRTATVHSSRFRLLGDGEGVNGSGGSLAIGDTNATKTNSDSDINNKNKSDSDTSSSSASGSNASGSSDSSSGSSIRSSGGSDSRSSTVGSRSSTGGSTGSTLVDQLWKN